MNILTATNLDLVQKQITDMRDSAIESIRHAAAKLLDDALRAPELGKAMAALFPTTLEMAPASLAAAFVTDIHLHHDREYQRDSVSVSLLGTNAYAEGFVKEMLKGDYHVYVAVVRKSDQGAR